MTHLSLIIPAYNEEMRLRETVEKYVAFFRSVKIDYEIILVPNHCTDTTPEIAASLAAANSRVRVHTIPGFSGKGGAVLKGFSLAAGDLIGFVDADHSVSPEQFSKLIVEAKRKKAVIASRALPGSVIPVPQSLPRRMLGTIFRILVNRLFGLNIKDSQCGAKLFHSSVLKPLVPSIKSVGWEFDVELLWRLKKNAIPLHEVAIEWRDSSESKMGLLDPLRMLIGLIRLRIEG